MASRLVRQPSGINASTGRLRRSTETRHFSRKEALVSVCDRRHVQRVSHESQGRARYGVHRGRGAAQVKAASHDRSNHEETGGDASSTAHNGAESHANWLQLAARACRLAHDSLDGMWGKFMPMASLFFLMAFVNTILDSLKDTLVITAVGGGANVIPWLTVYAVLPFSIVFLVLFNHMSGFMSREMLFDTIISSFLVFLLVFAFLMYPNHAALHPHAAADVWVQQVPRGLAGLVGMVRNWTFTVFYCASEMWGDVGLSLLFWGLANETTSMQDAPILYPLFGVGANVAQVLAGQCLRTLAVSLGGAHDAFVVQVQYISMLMVAMCLGILALHKYITVRHKAEQAEAELKRPPPPSPSRSSHHLRIDQPLRSNGAGGPEPAEPQRGAPASAPGPSGAPAETQTAYRAPPTASPPRTESSKGASSSNSGKGTSMSFTQALRYCWETTTIRCLATMAVAQGLCSNLAEYAWKSHVRLLHPTPQGFSGFMGDVASWTGVITVGMMIAAPTAFKTLGWRRTARATPDFLLFGGGCFFAACAVYQLSSGVVAPALHHHMLKFLAVAGAFLYVISRSAKFSLFKPAEEMVYISLDQRARLNGKATVDVFGAQFGKSSGSIMQQALLLLTAGSLLHSLPVMIVVFLYIATKWGKSVDQLSAIVGTHTSLQSVDFDDEDAYEEYVARGGGSRAPVDTSDAVQEPPISELDASPARL